MSVLQIRESDKLNDRPLYNTDNIDKGKNIIRSKSAGS